MENLNVAEWLMLSRMYKEREEVRCETCSNCTVCRNRKSQYPEYSMNYPQLMPPKLLRVDPEDLRIRKTQIYSPERYVTPTPDLLQERNERINKRKYYERYEEVRDYEKKRFCSPYSYIEHHSTSPPVTPPMTPPMTPPSTLHPQPRTMPPKQSSLDTVSSSGDDDEKILDKEFHKKEVERAKYERTIKLYKFLIDLLEEQNPCVVWITRETGIFKIRDSERLAQLWGEVKLNPTMNYEKLARSFRHYYKKGILDSGTTLSKCGKRKLYYKFSAQMLKKYLNI